MLARDDLRPLLHFYLPEMTKRAAARVGIARHSQED
jgi:hypothetical protein